MQKTIETLTEIVRKYRAKNLGNPELAQKLSEDLIKTIGITELDSTVVIKDLILSQYRNVNLGDTNLNRRLVEDVMFTFDKAGSGVNPDLDMPDGLHEIEQPLTREQVAAMYSEKTEEASEEDSLDTEATEEGEVVAVKTNKKSIPKRKKYTKRRRR